MSMAPPLPTHTQPLIPGAYELSTLTHRQPGSIGGPAFGAENVTSSVDSMSAATIADRTREGGGVSAAVNRNIEHWAPVWLRRAWRSYERD